MSYSYDQTTNAQSTTARPSIYSIYARYKKRMRNAGIALFLILVIYAIYAEGSVTVVSDMTSLIYPLLKEGSALPLLGGLLNKRDVDGDRALLMTRVSTKAQGDNWSTASQRESLENAAEENDLEVVDVLEAAESGAKIERDQLNEALERAQNSEYDILMVYEVDRLSRAEPWDTMNYLGKLCNAGVTLYCDSYGYFDWDEHYDFEILSREAAFARRWLDRLHDGSRKGYEQSLKNGEWPFGSNPPVGYETDDNSKIHLDSDYGEYIPKFFDIYAETGNRKETHRQLNSIFEENGLETISYSQVKTVLQSKLCIGKLGYDGDVVAECPELKMVQKDRFHEVQSILSSQESAKSSSEIPEFLGDATEIYGLDFVMGLFESFKPFRCRECDGDLERHGTKEIWGVKFPRYQCGCCEYQGPLVTAEELKKLHQTLPLRCPFCSATEDFDISPLRQLGTKFDHTYACSNCGLSFGCNLGPNRLARRFDHPNLGFEIGDDDDGDESDDDEPQSAIDDFSDL
ncbi:hypothetical protein JCM17823_16260 [Halorubrum gandharaense]